MSAPNNPNIDLQVDRGLGLQLEINRRPVRPVHTAPVRRPDLDDGDHGVELPCCRSGAAGADRAL